VTPFLKIAYQPYKWIMVIPFLFLITMFFGLIAIFTGLLFKQDAVNIVAVIWSIDILPSDSLDLIPGTIELIVHPPVHFLNHHLTHLDERIEQTRQVISNAL